MTDPTEADKVDKADISKENIFQIMDGIIAQSNKTKKNVYHNDSDHHDHSTNSICTYIRTIWATIPL